MTKTEHRANTLKSTGKSRVLFLLRYLQANTDDGHGISTNELITVLREHGFMANRDTLRSDVAALNEVGFAVASRREGKGLAYHFDGRAFDMAEMQMLVDAVASSRFISKERSIALIEKMSSLVSDRDAARLKANVHAEDWIKSANNQIFAIIDCLSRAIDQRKKISFQYFDYSPKREIVLRHDGETYINSPCAMVWQEDRYYLLGYSDKRKQVVSFRIDRMTLPRILDEDAVIVPDFRAEEYAHTAIRMYSGKECRVKLRCRNDLMRSLVDRFGLRFSVDEDTADTFIAEVKVQVSPTFYGWLTQYQDGIELLGPPSVRSEFRNLLEGIIGKLKQ